MIDKSHWLNYLNHPLLLFQHKFPITMCSETFLKLTSIKLIRYILKIYKLHSYTDDNFKINKLVLFVWSSDLHNPEKK